jgi:hypothetical protein
MANSGPEMTQPGTGLERKIHMTVGKTDHFTLSGWPAVGAMMALAAIRSLTALLAAVPILWLGRHIFGGVLLRFVFGAEGLTYWRCVGLFAIWFATRLRIKISGLSQIQITGDR